MKTPSKSVPKFEIINGKWIRRSSSLSNDVNTTSLKIDAIKRFSTYVNAKDGSGFKQEIWFVIYLEIATENCLVFEYRPEEKEEFLRDKKTLEDLLFNR